MEKLYTVLAIPFLAFLNFSLSYYSLHFYYKPTELLPLVKKLQQIFLVQFIFWPLVPLFVWAQDIHDIATFSIVCGLCIGFIICSLINSLNTIIFNNPRNDRSVFMISSQLFFLGFHTLLTPNLFMIGWFCGAVIWLFSLFLYKQKICNTLMLIYPS